MADEHRCAEAMFDVANAPTNPMHDLPGAMAVSETRPEVWRAEFPPQPYRCPHGVLFYTYPTSERITALLALNGASDG